MKSKEALSSSFSYEKRSSIRLSGIGFLNVKGPVLIELYYHTMINKVR